MPSYSGKRMNAGKWLWYQTFQIELRRDYFGYTWYETSSEEHQGHVDHVYEHQLVLSLYRSIQLKWRHCYNSVISEWNWIFQLLQRPSGKSLPIWPLRGWKPCASEAQWSWQTKSSVPPTHGLRPTPWTTPTTLAHSWCIFFDFLGTWHFD